eukprot:gene33529-43054_t
MTGIERQRLAELLARADVVALLAALNRDGEEARIVGGAVRNALLGEPVADIDVATTCLPQETMRRARAAGFKAVPTGMEHGTVTVVIEGVPFEVTTLRRDVETAGRHAVVAFGRDFREDALRRDFTINAMYYDPAAQIVLDYHGGMDDIRAKTLRIIGVPEERYREDPVRMLRVVRFAAKLKFSIDAATGAPIAVMAPLINNVPAARVFDEMLKLLMSGHALACLQQLRTQGLHHGLLPLLDVVLEQPLGEKFVTLALANTDSRISQGKPVSPGFLFASLLWHQ